MAFYLSIYIYFYGLRRYSQMYGLINKELNKDWLTLISSILSEQNWSNLFTCKFGFLNVHLMDNSEVSLLFVIIIYEKKEKFAIGICQIISFFIFKAAWLFYHKIINFFSIIKIFPQLMLKIRIMHFFRAKSKIWRLWQK